MMMKELLEQQVFMYAMLGLCIAGSIVKCMLSIIYGGLVKASFHMADTENRLFKLMRLKFEAFYKLKMSVRNVENFVDRYVMNHKCCGLFLHTWKKFTSQMTFLCICVGVSGAILGMIGECSSRLVLEHLGMGLLTGAFLYVLDGLCAIDFKQLQLRANAVDYFDNFLRARLESEYFHSEKEREYPQAYGKQDMQEQAAASREQAEERKSGRTPERKAGPEPVPAKRKREPEMFVPPSEETAAGKETAKAKRSHKLEEEKIDQEMLERSMEEVEKEKIIEDILKEYLV